MADQIAVPLSDAAQSLGRVFVGVTIALSVVSTFIFGARVYTRARPVFRFGWDDYIVTIAYIFVMINWAILFAAVQWVFHPSTQSLSLHEIEYYFKLAIIAQPLWAWSMAFIKISVACMLLRVQHTAAWRHFLYIMIFIQILMAIFNTAFQLTQCIPLHAAWDLLGVVPARCWSEKTRQISSNMMSLVNVATDIIFSLIPITFLRKIQRPLRERLVIGILMGLGLFASTASIIKAIAIDELGRTDDATAGGITVGLWSCVEEQLGFIAACVPCLKSLLQSALKHIGILSSTGEKSYTRAGSYSQTYSAVSRSRNDSTGTGQIKLKISRSGSNSQSLSSKSGRDSIRMKKLAFSATGPTKSQENILHDNASSGIVEDVAASSDRILCTTEIRLEVGSATLGENKRAISPWEELDPGTSRSPSSIEAEKQNNNKGATRIL